MPFTVENGWICHDNLSCCVSKCFLLPFEEAIKRSIEQIIFGLDPDIWCFLIFFYYFGEMTAADSICLTGSSVELYVHHRSLLKRGNVGLFLGHLDFFLMLRWILQSYCSISFYLWCKYDRIRENLHPLKIK